MIAVESADTKKISFNSLTFRDNEQVIAEKIPV